MRSDESILVIGGGLSGMALSYYLSKMGKRVMLAESSSRLGGRIHTFNGELETPLELGATWFSDIHIHLMELIKELKLEKFLQYAKGNSVFQMKSFVPPQKFVIPEADPPAYRLVGGTQKLIEKLFKAQPDLLIRLDTAVTAIHETESGIYAETAKQEKLFAHKVIVCIPPQLCAAKISFTPELPVELKDMMPKVQTWLAGTLKFVVEYEQAFWRNDGYSGTLFSHPEAGPIIEMYDHCSADQHKFGFTGFLSPNTAGFTEDVRRDLVIKQLAGFFGPQAGKFRTYKDKLWNDAYLLAGTQIVQLPRQAIGDEILQRAYMHEKLYFSGTESSPEYGGYMDGAIFAAKRTAALL